MKKNNLWRLSFVALAAASCMTSCIENEEDESVTALREQAKEQAQANIEKTKAETELERAKLAQQLLINKQQELMNALQELLNAEQGMKNEQLAAQVAMKVEQYKAELAEAQLATKKAQAALEQDMKMYAADCVIEDYNKICTAYREVLSAQENLASAQRNLADSQKALADYLAGKNGSDVLASVTSNIVMKENQISSQETALATLKAFYTELKSQSLNRVSASEKRGELRNQINDLVAKIAENDLAQQEASVALGVKKNKLYAEYQDLCTDRDNAKSQQEEEYRTGQRDLYSWLNTIAEYRIVFDSEYYSTIYSIVYDDYDVSRVLAVVDNAIIVNSNYSSVFSNSFLCESVYNTTVYYSYYNSGITTNNYYYNGRYISLNESVWYNNSSIQNPIYWLRTRTVSRRDNYAVGTAEYEALQSVISQIDAVYSASHNEYEKRANSLSDKHNSCLSVVYQAQVKVEDKYAEYNAIQDEDNYYEYWYLRTYYNETSSNYSSTQYYGAYNFAAYDAQLVYAKVEMIKKLQILYTLEAAYSDYSNAAISLDNQILNIENNIASAESVLAGYKAELEDLNDKLASIKAGEYDPERMVSYYKEQIAKYEARVTAYALILEQASQAYEAVVAAIKK